jgi:hypothetical protein
MAAENHGEGRSQRRRRFFAGWITFTLVLAATEIIACLVVAAMVPGHVLHWPPAWVYITDLLGGAIPASRSTNGRTPASSRPTSG